MRVQDNRELEASQVAESVRSDVCTDGAATCAVTARFCDSAAGETRGEKPPEFAAEPDAESSYKERGSRFRPGAPWERDPRYGGAPPIGAVRTHFGVLGYVDPDGPAPVHPRSCPGEGSCIYCVALQHWQSCQILKAQRAAAPAKNDAAGPERRPPAATVERGERRWKRKKRKALPPPSDEGGRE